jgi:hypothetical protein
MHPGNRKKIKIKVGKQRRGESGIGERVHDLFIYLFIVGTSIRLLLIARNKKRSPFKHCFCFVINFCLIID